MLHSYMIPSPVWIPNTSLKFVGLSVKHPGIMSFKCWRSVESAFYQEMRDTKAVHHFEEKNYQGDDLHANCNKID